MCDVTCKAGKLDEHPALGLNFAGPRRRGLALGGGNDRGRICSSTPTEPLSSLPS